jgi:hypothetical protein
MSLLRSWSRFSLDFAIKIMLLRSTQSDLLPAFPAWFAGVAFVAIVMGALLTEPMRKLPASGVGHRFYRIQIAIYRLYRFMALWH